MQLITRLSPSLALAAFALPASAAEPPASITAAVDREIEALMAQHDIPGMAVAVTVDGQAYIFNYGTVERGEDRDVNDETIFEIGSVSKVITAMLATYAIERGALSLSDTPGRYMPELSGTPVDDATVLHLGTYTAGGFPLQFPDAVTNDASMVEYYRDWQPDAEPGTVRQYSNPSLGLFGHLAALSMERPYADLIEGAIFPGLSMNTSYINVPDERMDDYSWGHSGSGNKVRVNPGVLDGQAYGVKTTASDLIRFVEANIRPQSLEGDMQKAVEGTQIGYFRSGELVQSLGWEQYSYPTPLAQLVAGNSTEMALEPHAAAAIEPAERPATPTLFNKTGSTGGFGAYVAFVPDEEIGVVMLANRFYPNSARVEAGYAILEALADAR
ncbi:class C beta-lactamase [Aliihoeflea sp. PC F10.4]